MEVTDPYSNTTTVKNILQHIIVPKIVNDGSDGYVTRTDLVNIDNIIFRAPSTNFGTETRPLTSQSGTFNTTTKLATIYHSRVKTTSIIIACTQSADNAHDVTYVLPKNGSFVVSIANEPNEVRPIIKVGWFIVHF
jgi:hypothetical protein